MFSYPMFRDLERVQTVFTGIAAHNAFGANIASGGQTEGGDGCWSPAATSRCWACAGSRPASRPDDDREQGGGHVVVISHEYWRRRFGARADVIDQALAVNGQAMTIVGVAPRGFRGTTLGNVPLMFVPISMRDVLVPRWKGLENRRTYWAYLFARLKPGVSREQARATLNVQYRSIINEVDVPLQKA